MQLFSGRENFRLARPTNFTHASVIAGWAVAFADTLVQRSAVYTLKRIITARSGSYTTTHSTSSVRLEL